MNKEYEIQRAEKANMTLEHWLAQKASRAALRAARLASAKERKKETPEESKRKKSFGEFFTPPKLVNYMLDRLAPDSFGDPTKTVLDPSCGDGAFIIPIMERKLAAGIDPQDIAAKVFGVEIQEPLVKIVRKRALALLGDDPIIRYRLATNIVCNNFLTYDRSFNQPQWFNDDFSPYIVKTDSTDSVHKAAAVVNLLGPDTKILVMAGWAYIFPNIKDLNLYGKDYQYDPINQTGHQKKVA